ncbi:hypothetical protein OSB04_007971 [Centaurea solstitialis]|uniref:glycerophosphodiester phosphodiesterase n=1 Tax=Centaurea solstitialis TaxID=347529 RepID=A0AA38TWE1_9ASTR|nr:hypothetical protein OSB04_007971 [Centaurea solstitialis]
MWNLLYLIPLISFISVAAQPPPAPTSQWQTLTGDPPFVVARGGFSGLLPDSSFNAYTFAMLTSVSDVIMWCDVQLTKDNAGICFPSLNLENSSTIAAVYAGRDRTYDVNGVSTKGYFPVDFTLADLEKCILASILDLRLLMQLPRFFLLKSCYENKTARIVVEYPDAHKENLEVFASGFVNDVQLPYNYSYDPVQEYLSFVDNGRFAVDGVLSDNPITASSALDANYSFVLRTDCFAHSGRNKTQDTPLIITFEGASGDYPGCTDLAYEKAVSDGADIIDCPVQMTQDGIPICLGSINLLDRTSVGNTDFINLTTNIPSFKLMGYLPSVSRGQIFSVWIVSTLLPTFMPSIISEYVEPDQVLISFERGSPVRHINDTETSQQNTVKSPDSSVLKLFKARSNRHELVYEVNENIRDALNSTIQDIRNRCLGLPAEQTPPYMSAAAAGQLYPLMTPQFMPPVGAPNPVLTDEDVAEARYSGTRPSRQRLVVHHA